jgi:poly(3-hydroxybutyrate) depolymerase
MLLTLAGAACSGDDSSGQDGSGAFGGAGATSSGGTTSSGGATSTTSGGGAGAGGSGGSPSSSGCGKSSAVGTQALSIDVGGTARTFVLSVPQSYQPSTPLALVFAWHGMGGSGSGAQAYFGIEQQAAGAAIFVYPDGLPVNGGETGWDLDLAGPDVAFFDAVRAQIEADYCIDVAREFSTGHSFGGYMTNTVGCARASLLRGIAPVAGGGPWGACDPAPLSALVIHGSNDTTVDPAEGQASLDYWRSHASCSDASQPIEPAGCVEYPGCVAGRVLFCSHDEGHNWPALAPAAVWGFFASL